MAEAVEQRNETASVDKRTSDVAEVDEAARALQKEEARRVREADEYLGEVVAIPLVAGGASYIIALSETGERFPGATSLFVALGATAVSLAGMFLLSRKEQD